MTPDRLKIIVGKEINEKAIIFTKGPNNTIVLASVDEHTGDQYHAEISEEEKEELRKLLDNKQ